MIFVLLLFWWILGFYIWIVMLSSLDNIQRVWIHGGVCEKEGYAWAKENNFWVDNGSTVIASASTLPTTMSWKQLKMPFPMVIHAFSPEVSIPYYLCDWRKHYGLTKFHLDCKYWKETRVRYGRSLGIVQPRYLLQWQHGIFCK
jgi:hypothetical protein